MAGFPTLPDYAAYCDCPECPECPESRVYLVNPRSKPGKIFDKRTPTNQPSSQTQARDQGSITFLVKAVSYVTQINQQERAPACLIQSAVHVVI